MKLEKHMGQDLQRRFDETHGFDKLPYPSDTVLSDEDIGSLSQRMQFAALAAVGEFGEFCNLLKKSIRLRSYAPGSQIPMDALSRELGDVQAYLFKLASLMRCELAEVHLETILLNCVRFPARTDHKAKLIAVCGPPGSGKTTAVTLAFKLMGRSSCFAYVERFEENPHLQKFNAAPEETLCLASQRWFLRSIEEFAKQLSATDPACALLDQDPTAIALVYSRIYKDREFLRREDYYDHLTRLVELELQLANQFNRRSVVLLDAPVDILWERSREKLGHFSDLGDWILAVKDRFTSVYGNMPNVVSIDTSRTPPEEVSRLIAELARE